MTRRKHRKAPLIMAALILLLVAALYASNRIVGLTRYELVSAALPKAFDGYTIAQISDLHSAEYGENNQKLIDMTLKADPDIIAVTGDIVERDSEFAAAARLCERLGEIAPVYFVAGNHEWACDDPRELFYQLEQAGVTVLENDAVTLTLAGESITLAGIGDPNGPYDQIEPEAFLASLPEGFSLVLYHRNDELDMLAQGGADVVLCGHAHGGLVRLPFVGGLINSEREWFPDYTAGVYASGGTSMVVSRGLGNAGRTFRLFNSPELVIVTLKSK